MADPLASNQHSTQAATEPDDRLTVISIAVACVLQDILHEGLGWIGALHFRDNFFYEALNPRRA